jgi:AraC-like DNA-binding protein
LIPGYTLLAAPSLAEFGRHHLDLQRITFHADFFSLREERDRTAFSFGRPAGYAPTRHSVEYTAVALQRALRQYFDIVPSRVTFIHPPPADAREHERILGCPVDFARSENALVFSRDEFEKERPQFSGATFDSMSGTAERMLRDLESPAFREQVRGLLRRRIGKGGLDIDSVSRGVHVSTRTLQRRLAAEGTRYQNVLDAVRYEVAVDRVRSGARIREAAKATGFADAASFCRAFRRWTGRTPEEFRNRSGT